MSRVFLVAQPTELLRRTGLGGVGCRCRSDSHSYWRRHGFGCLVDAVGGNSAASGPAATGSGDRPSHRSVGRSSHSCGEQLALQSRDVCSGRSDGHDDDRQRRRRRRLRGGFPCQGSAPTQKGEKHTGDKRPESRHRISSKLKVACNAKPWRNSRA
jgi:hypothetical protein